MTDAVQHDMSLKRVLEQSSKELVHSVRACTELQWVISRLLDKSQHPDLVAEMRVLQDIDRLQQTLAELACLFETISTNGPGLSCDVSAALGAMRLPSLRERMFAPAHKPSPHEVSDDTDEVTWL